jgi:Domain of unknown function (DUF4389)
MEFLPVLDVFPPERERRWTVLLRLLLLIPQGIVVALLGIVAAIVVFIGWFGALVLGRLPEFAAGYLARYLAYETRVEGYGMLLVDRYPPFAFDAPDYPVRIEVRPGELNRLAVFFRLLLVIPAGIVQAVIYSGWTVCCFFIWLVVLVLGRMPQAAFQATASVLRYKLRIDAYMFLLTPAYPKRLLGDQPGRDYDQSWGLASATRPLVLTGGGQGLLVLFIVLGVIAQIADGVGDSHH